MCSVLEVAGSQEGEIPAIGTLNEGALHAQLKNWYQRPDDRIERVVDGFVVDLIRGDLLVEIQTGSFAPLRRKLELLTRQHPVRLVAPVPRSAGTDGSWPAVDLSRSSSPSASPAPTMPRVCSRPACPNSSTPPNSPRQPQSSAGSPNR